MRFRKANSFGRKFPKGQPEYIILHYTATETGGAAIRWFRHPQCRVSAHYVVGSGGQLTCCVKPNRVAYHAGISRYNDVSSFNRCSIGIEIANLGLLYESRIRTSLNREATKGEVDKLIEGMISKNPRFERFAKDNILIAPTRTRDGFYYGVWQKFSNLQIRAVEKLIEDLSKRFNIKGVYGHHHISGMDVRPTRYKIDPGPALPHYLYKGL